jgi:2-hydroxychromene-2-carboxylate isomerase
MAKQIDYFLTPTSPWTYLGHARFAEMAQRHGAAVAGAVARGKVIYIGNTQEAVARQVFGAPTYVYRDELFWGQDRLDFLEAALAR